MNVSSFENFPACLVAACNSVGLGIYAIGLYLMARLGIWWAVLYALYCVWMEWRLLAGSCRYCFYYGKLCGFGRGRVASWFFPPGAGGSFGARQITWWDLAPDLLVSLVPLVAGVVLLLRRFSWPLLLLVLLLAGLATFGTGLVRGWMACKYCRQRELGCPAERLFGKAERPAPPPPPA